MKKTILFIGSFFFILSYNGAHASSSCPTPKELEALPAPSVADRAWISSRIYQMVTTRFAHMEALGPSYDFNKQYRRYLSSIATVTTRLSFDREISKIFANLHNGHTRFLDNLAACATTLPFRVDFIQGKWIVTVSHLDSLPLGAEPVSINHEDFAHWADKQVTFIADSSLRSQRRLLSSRGYGAWLWPQHFSLVIRQPDNGETSVIVDRNAPIPSVEKSRYGVLSGVMVTHVTPALTRIGVSGFDHPENEPKILEAVKKYASSPALLLDLRETEGGMFPLRLVLALLENPTKDMLSFTPQRIAVNDAYNEAGVPELALFPNTWMRYGGEILNPQPLYHGKLFILTDGGCASACEGFVMLMKSSKRAVILGEPTWGINGNRSEIVLSDQNMAFGVGTEEVRWPDGSKFEGIGVIPDVSIPLTQEELLAGKDAVLEKAINYIENIMKDDHHGQ